MRTKQLLYLLITLATLGFFTFIFVSSQLWKWVPAGEVAIIYNANAGVQRDRVLSPGRHILSPLDQLITAPTKIMPAYYSQDPDYGEQKQADGIQITTRQGSTVTFDVLVLYQVKKENVWKVFDNFARQPIEVIQSTRIRREVKNVANTVGKGFFLEELIGAKRPEANAQLTKELASAMAPLGFSVQGAFFVTAYPNPAQASQLLAIATADINKEIASTEAGAAEKEKTIAITLAKARKEAADLVAVSTTQTSVQLQRLDIEKARLEKWNGSNLKIDTTGLNSVFVDPKLLQGGSK